MVQAGAIRRGCRRGCCLVRVRPGEDRDARLVPLPDGGSGDVVGDGCAAGQPLDDRLHHRQGGHHDLPAGAGTLHVAVFQGPVNGRVGEHVDAACLRQQHRVSCGGVGDGTQTVRMGGFHERPDRELVEAGRIDDDLDVVDALGDALGDVGPRLVGIGDQALRAPHPLGVHAGGVGGTGAARAHVGDTGSAAQRRDQLGRPGSHVQPGGDAVAGQRRQRCVISEMDVAVDQPGQQHTPATVPGASACLVVADAVAVDDDRRRLEQPLAVEYPHVGQRDLVHVFSSPYRPQSMAIVVSRNPVSPCCSAAGVGQTAETT